MSPNVLNSRNNLLRGMVFTGLGILAISIAFIALVKFDFLRDSIEVRNTYLHVLLYSLAIGGIFYLARVLINFHAHRLNKTYFKQFHRVGPLGTYEESEQRLFFSQRRLKHAVLCLHGFSASPQEFRHLCQAFEAADIPFYAPSIAGFGADSTKILRAMRFQDWLRSALYAYDVLANVAENVSIVGVSMGADLAMAIAERRQTHKLLLVSPALFIHGGSRWRKILAMPVISTLFSWFVPYIAKPVNKKRGSTLDILDKTASDDLFHYLALPTSSVKQLLLLQRSVRRHIDKMNYQALQIFYGEHDITIDLKRCLDLFTAKQVAFTACGFKQTGHSPFEDYDRDEACSLALKFLSEASLEKTTDPMRAA